jgi:hypothetical protein
MHLEVNKLVYEATIDGEDISTEDGGQAKIATITEDNDDTDGVFFRFQSWCEKGALDHTFHPVFDALVKPGKRVRITLEIIN